MYAMSQMEDESKNAAAPFPGFQVSKLKKKKTFFLRHWRRDKYGNEKEFVYERDSMVQNWQRPKGAKKSFNFTAKFC
jgi:hypothetical protein